MDRFKYIASALLIGSLAGILFILSSDDVFLKNLETWVNPPKVVTTEANSVDNLKNAVKVAEVIDGDTVRLESGERVRYLYVDTPETKKPSTPVECFGAEASEFNKKTTELKLVNLVTDKESKDQYGRDLRIVFLAGRDTSDFGQSINAELVRKGYARARFYSPNTKYKSEVEALEKQAKQEKLGLWAKC
jgi:micrococcal nuclease